MLLQIFATMGKAQLLANVVAMKIDSAGSARQRLGNFLCTAPLDDQLDNFGLCWRQPFQRPGQPTRESRCDILEISFNNVEMR